MEADTIGPVSIAVVDLQERLGALETAICGDSNDIRFLLPSLANLLSEGECEELPDIYLIRARAPEFLGIEACRKLKLRASSAGIPVILLADDGSSPQDRIRAYEAGAYDVCPEAIDPRELAVKVRNCIRYREEGEALRRSLNVVQLSSSARIRRFSRLNSMLSTISKTMLRRRAPRDLFSEACRLAVDEGGVALAWVGVVDSEHGQVETVGCHGVGAGFFAQVKMKLEGEDLLENPVIACILAKNPYFVEDITDSNVIPEWREFARRQGFRSIGAFPLLGGAAIEPGSSAAESTAPERAIGALLLFASDAGFFSIEESEIFGTLAENLSFALESVRHEGLRQKAENERISLEKRLRESQKLEAVGTLAAGIAHDFNNILAAIMGFADLVKLQLPPGGRPHRNMEEILIASKRARALVGQILAFSRQSDGDSKPVELGPIIGETIEFLRATLPANIRIITSISPDSGQVMADNNQMQQVILHLTTNAMYAMREKGGLLEFIVRPTEVVPGRKNDFASLAPGKYVQLTIHDTGVGMDRATLDRVFEPYFTTKPVGQGSGLGLAVVHGIISNHHGVILVESKPGEGTSIHLFLPRLEESPEPVFEQVEEVGAGQKGRVLVVDDESVLVKFLIQGMEYLGYQAVGFDDSREALKAFTAAPDSFDLIITDQCMPELEGAELATAIHKVDPRKPVILTSGFNELPEGTNTTDIAALLVKPMALGDLEKIVSKVLKRAHTAKK